MNGNTVQILVAMVIYMAAVIVIGIMYAKKANKSSDQYFLGGRSLGPWVTAMSAEASDMSGWLWMGLPGVAYWFGLADAAWTAIGKTDSINWMICGAFGVAITTFVGQNFGAQKYARVRKSVWVCMAMAIPVVAGVSAIVLPLRSFILGIYTDDLEVIRSGAHIMLFMMPFNFIFVPVEVFAGTMRGVGSSLTPTLITGSCVCLFRVLWVTVLVKRIHTIEMLAIAYPISWALAALVFFLVYFRGSWMKKRIEACGMAPEA